MAHKKEKEPTSLEVPTVSAPIKSTRKIKSKHSFNKNTLSVLRTTLRNNIELTSVADNKANVLLSLNAMMLTFLVPLILPHLDTVKSLHLATPLILLASTCIATIYLSALVLKPSKLKGQDIKFENTRDHISPFFFGNFLSMKKSEFIDYSAEVLNDDYLVKSFVYNDFYHIGHRLAQKMKIVRLAYNLFLVGMLVSIILTIVLVIRFA